MTFYGWRVVAGAFLVLCLAYGTQYSFGIFFAALHDATGGYDVAWALAAGLNVVAIALLALCRPPRSAPAAARTGAMTRPPGVGKAGRGC